MTVENGLVNNLKKLQESLVNATNKMQESTHTVDKMQESIIYYRMKK